MLDKALVKYNWSIRLLGTYTPPADVTTGTAHQAFNEKGNYFMKMSRQALGAWGEEQAADYLIKAGYEILDRNVRTSYGEIDLVAWHEYATERHTGDASKHGMIVFVEVKTRRSTSFGYPEQAVNSRKLEHMIASAQAYLQENLDYESAYRIDVIAILHTNPGKEPEIIHFENAA